MHAVHQCYSHTTPEVTLNGVLVLLGPQLLRGSGPPPVFHVCPRSCTHSCPERGLRQQIICDLRCSGVVTREDTKTLQQERGRPVQWAE